MRYSPVRLQARICHPIPNLCQGWWHSSSSAYECLTDSWLEMRSSDWEYRLSRLWIELDAACWIRAHTSGGFDVPISVLPDFTIHWDSRSSQLIMCVSDSDGTAYRIWHGMTLTESEAECLITSPKIESLEGQESIVPFSWDNELLPIRARSCAMACTYSSGLEYAEKQR